MINFRKLSQKLGFGRNSKTPAEALFLKQERRYAKQQVKDAKAIRDQAYAILAEAKALHRSGLTLPPARPNPLQQALRPMQMQLAQWPGRAYNPLTMQALARMHDVEIVVWERVGKTGALKKTGKFNPGGGRPVANLLADKGQFHALQTQGGFAEPGPAVPASRVGEAIAQAADDFDKQRRGERGVWAEKLFHEGQPKN